MIKMCTRKMLLRAAFTVGLAAVSATAMAQAPDSPKAGSPERKAIMDAMRAKGDGKDRVFVVRRLRVAGGWAWLDVEPQSRDGRNRYEAESALLRRDGNAWAVVDQPCSEEGCNRGGELVRIRAAFPSAPASIFP